MKRLLAVALGLALVGATLLAAPLTVRIPAGVPDGEALGWEKITGDVETPSAHVVYTFYVNPARGAIYELTRYRVTRFVVKEGRRTVVPDTEKFVWHAHPGTGQVPLCFALGAEGLWKVVLPGTPEYQLEMGTAMQVYALHRQATVPQ